MNITTKTERTFNIADLTETQATDILKLCSGRAEYVQLDIRDDSVQETLDVLRSGLLNAGATLPDGGDDES